MTASSGKRNRAGKIPYFHRAIGDVVRGQQDRKLLFIGDSITSGWDGSHYGKGIFPTMAKRLTSRGVNAEVGLSIPPYSNGTDLKWTKTAAWTQSTNTTGFLWGGLNIMYGSAGGAGANTLNFTPGTMCDSFDVYYTGAGSFHMNIDGGTDTVITGVDNNVHKASIAGVSPATNHVLNIGTSTAPLVEILGVEAKLSTAKTLRCGNAGVGTATAVGWAKSSVHPGPLDCITQYAPDTTVIRIGGNDVNNSGTNTDVTTALSTILTTCRATGDVILYNYYMPNPALGYNPGMLSLDQALRDWCDTNAVPYIDIFGPWGGQTAYAKLNSLGYFAGDGLHLSDLGYTDQGIMIADALLDL